MFALRTRARGLLAAGLLLSAGACGGAEVTAIEPEPAAAYRATTFTVATPTGTRDLLAEGARLELFFHEAGGVTGYLLVPGGNDDGTDLSEELEGTWEVEVYHLILATDADTFLREAVFLFRDDRLIYERAGVRVVLTEDSLI